MKGTLDVVSFSTCMRQPDKHDSIDSIVTDPPYALVSIVKRFGAANAAGVKVPEGGSGAYARASAGTGTTGEAAFREGFNAIPIEREEEYQADIRRRMGLVLSGPDERSRESIKARTAGQPIDHGPLFGGLDTPPPTGQENLRGIRGRTIGPTGLKW